MERYLRVEDYLRKLPHLKVGSRRIDCVVLHCTAKPTEAQWRGERTAEGIREAWFRRQAAEGWHNPPGAHFIVGPDGTLWLPFQLPQVLNANTDEEANAHGIAIEAVGNYDRGHDVLDGSELHAVMGLIGGLLVRFQLTPADLYFHRDFPKSGKTCPGTGLNREQVRAAAAKGMLWARRVMGG